jgi:hypothetical protein
MCIDLTGVDVEKFVFSMNVYRLDIHDYASIMGLHIVLESSL